ncbi:MAG: hypothetical protein P4N60_08110 [Verrucomicrobiae bacterium]|nr:hypothetical protein [Verrucomicrobiae bacterium]
MIQAIKTYLQDKIDESDADFTKKLYLGGAILVIGLVMFFYYQHVVYRTYHKHGAYVTQAAPASPVPVPDPVAAPAPYTPPTPPAAPQVEPAAAAPAVTAVSSNALAGNDTPGNLGGSMMSALSPSARPETITPGFQSVKTLDGPAAVPTARRPLKTPAPARHEAPLTEEQKLVKAAQDGLERAMDLAVKNPDAFGFAAGDKIDMVKLGDPVRVYSIADADRDSYRDAQSLKSILSPTKEWIFPVMLDGHICFILPVRCTGTEYVAGHYSRALAMVYEKILERWPASEGYHPQFVVTPNRTAYYFTVPELPDQNLTDTSAMFQYNPTLSPPSVILASWR